MEKDGVITCLVIGGILITIAMVYMIYLYKKNELIFNWKVFFIVFIGGCFIGYGLYNIHELEKD